MLYVLNHDFNLFAYQNITEFCRSILEWLPWYIKQTCHNDLSSLFKRANARFFTVLVFWSRARYKRSLRREIIVASPPNVLYIFRFEVTQLQSRKGNFLSYPYSKVIGSTSFQLRMSIYQSKVHKFFWKCNVFSILVERNFHLNNIMFRVYFTIFLL